MLPITAHTPLRPCIRRSGAPTASAVQQQQPWHNGLRSRQQQRHKQRSRATSSEASSGNEVPQVDRGVIFDSTPDDAPPTTSALQDTEALLQQLNLLKSQLSTAVAQEDYAAAQQLKERADALKQQLPPVQQYMLAQVAKLSSSNAAERRAAVNALGEVGDESCLPELASCLHDQELNKAGCDAMWAVFHRHPNPAVNKLMEQGVALLQPGSPLVKFRAALEVFDEACKLEPSFAEPSFAEMTSSSSTGSAGEAFKLGTSFAEAHNKRATLLYLMHRYEESIEVCQLVLQLNPYHFGAASGMGMCHLQLEDHPAALAAFQRALAINPAMEPIQTYVAALKAKLADDGISRPEGLALAINPAMEPIQTYVAALKAKLADDGIGRPAGL
ncbi:hypothetical protein OEZ86_008651 [Tetradesmus obliquus]|nr:hypothetical protein OEZ86_008651 [Tetradesmus obliquus]